MRWYLCFLGTVTIPLQAASQKAARAKIIDEYADRGVPLAAREVFVRLAKPTDVGWLRDMGANEVADAVAGASV